MERLADQTVDPVASDLLGTGDEEPEASAGLERVMEEGFRSVLDAFETKLAYDRSKEEQIERLHRELQDYKSDLLGRAVRPALLGLIRLHDDLTRAAERLAETDGEPPGPETFSDVIEGFTDDVELLLDRLGVTPFRNPDDRFDPRRQTAVVTCEPTGPDVVGLVAGRIRPGFEHGDAVLRKEKVAVFTPAGAPPSGPDLTGATIASDAVAQEEPT